MKEQNVRIKYSLKLSLLKSMLSRNILNENYSN